jgi:glutamate synthase (NADPH/NADH) large chain
MVTLSGLAASPLNEAYEGLDDDAPRARAISVRDSGMGDPLRHDAARLRLLIERHHRLTGSARAAALLADWDRTLGDFIKVTPNDYRSALMDMAARRAAARPVAAE